MQEKSSEFNPNSLILPVLEMIGNGLIAADIARSLKISPQRLSYYISKAKDIGFLKEEFRDTFKCLELTQPGKNFLDQYGKNRTSSLLQCRAENIQFRANIVLMPRIPVDWKKVEMHNWTQYYSQIDQVRVKINMGKNPTIEFLPSPVEGDDPFQIFVILVFEVVNVILKLIDTIGLRVGPLQLGSRGEWLIFDPIARMFCKFNGQVTYEGVAKVNASRPRSIGELEFFDPRALDDYLLMPPRVQAIDARTVDIQSILQKLVENSQFRQMQNQLSLFSLFTSMFGTPGSLVPLFIL